MLFERLEVGFGQIPKSQLFPKSRRHSGQKILPSFFPQGGRDNQVGFLQSGVMGNVKTTAAGRAVKFKHTKADVNTLSERIFE
jgi:hypothetical protein